MLTTHVRPDGDALGSMLAMYLSLELAGKQRHMVILDEVPRRYAFLFQQHSPAPARRFDELADAADLVVVLDTCAFAQLTPIAEALKARRSKVVVIDHHREADEVGYAIWRDESAAAVGVMVAELLEELCWPLDLAAAEGLMTAVCTDTGWFRYANTNAKAFHVAAGMVLAGVRPEALYAKLYQSDRAERVKLLAAALRSLELHAADRLAVMTLTQEDFARTGAAADETEDFANEPLRIARVEVAALLIEQSDGVVRASLRSRQLADVAKVAVGFGGGGHVRASGFRAEGDISTIKRRLIAGCTDAIQEFDL